MGDSATTGGASRIRGGLPGVSELSKLLIGSVASCLLPMRGTA